MHYEIMTKSQNDINVHELIQLFNHLSVLSQNAQEQHIQQMTTQLLQGNYNAFNPFAPFPDFDPQHFAHFSKDIQAKIPSIWELFQSISKLDHPIGPLDFPQINQLSKSVRFEDVKTKLMAAFKCLRRCPMILAMEMNQDNFVKFLLNSGMLYICNCANLTSMVTHSVNMFHSGIISYLQSKRSCLPKELNLEAACYGNDRLQYMIQAEDYKQQLRNVGAPDALVDRMQHSGLPLSDTFHMILLELTAMPPPGLSNNLIGAINNQQQAGMPFPGLPNNLIGAMNNHQLQALAAMPFPGLQNNPNPIGAANNQQAAMPFPGLPNNLIGGINNQIGAMNNHFQALAGMPFPGLPNYPNPIVAAINQQAAMPFPGLPNNLIGAMNNHQVQALAAMPFPGLPNNFNALINNQIQVPNAMPNNPAGPVNNQAQQAAMPFAGLPNNSVAPVYNQPQQAAVQNPGMPVNPAGGINNQQPQALQNPGAANAANGANDNQPLIEPDLE